MATREQEEAEWNDKVTMDMQKERESLDNAKTKTFLEDDRRATLTEREATNTTRTLAKNLQEEVSNQNLVSLLSNYQGTY